MKELKIITKDTLEDAADAIRTKLGTSDPIAPEDFDDAIDAIETGITPTGTIQITQNGTGIDVTNYASADVAVPTPTGTYSISENGTYNIANYASVEVACPSALMLGWTGDHWESAGAWDQLPSEEMPTPVGQEATLHLADELSPAPSEGDAVIACGSREGDVIVAGTVYNYVNNMLSITVAAMSSK